MPAANGCSSTRPVVDDVQVDDRRAAEPLGELGRDVLPAAAASCAARAGGTASTTASARTLKPSLASTSMPTSAVGWDRPRRDRARGAAHPHLDPRTFERPAGGRVVDVRQRRHRPADVSGGGVVEHADLEHLRGLCERGVVNREVQRRARDQLPDRLDRARVLACLPQPIAERARVVTRIVDVDRPAGAASPRPPPGARECCR